jgi:hypothetical protein
VVGDEAGESLDPGHLTVAEADDGLECGRDGVSLEDVFHPAAPLVVQQPGDRLLAEQPARALEAVVAPGDVPYGNRRRLRGADAAVAVDVVDGDASPP